MNQFPDDNEHRSPADPLGLDAIDQQIRINELRARVDALGVSSGSVSPECPPAIEERFLQNILDYESMPLSTDFDRLQAAGIELPTPESLDDASLTAKLWEVIYALGRLNTFLHSTDHLSDRELYSELWNEALREESAHFPLGSGWNHHIDLVSDGSDESTEAYLRYYADEESRQRWAVDFPQHKIPPQEEPKFKRGDRLPQAPPPPMWRGFDESDDHEEMNSS